MTINAIGIIPAKTASCSVMGDYAIKKKMVIKKSGNVKRGDLVLFDFNHNGTSDHIGIVVSVNKNGTYTTVEGNTSGDNDTNGGGVCKRTRYKSQINYFVRPKYTNAITADMAIATAMDEVGTVEKPRNSNNVKYNTWFYGKAVKGKAYPWCATFICWLFAHIKEKEIPIVKPTGKYAGTIAKPTLKKGSKGDEVKNLQKFLNWYHPAWKLAVDGDFGSNTDKALRAFQTTEKLAVDGVYGNKSYERAKTYEYVAPKQTTTPKPTTSTTNNKPTTKPTATLKSYKISIDLTNQICTVYGVYSDGSVKGIMSEFVSTARKGKTTPVGNWKIQGASGGRKAKYRTCKLSSGKTYAEYACRFTGAKMMHGVPYKTRNTKGYVYKGEFNKLGSVASAGCVRMPIKMARFIYNNCPIGTPVVVFKGKAGNYPMGKPKKYTATSNVDPTR